MLTQLARYWTALVLACTGIAAAAALHTAAATELAPELATGSTPRLHYRLETTLDPATAHLEVTAKLTFPALQSAPMRFALNQGLRISSATPPVRPLSVDPTQPSPAFRVYELAHRASTLTIEYAGTLKPPSREAATQAGSGALPAARADYAQGYVGAEGIYLDQHAVWYPYLDGRSFTFTLRVNLPPGWQAVSQGRPLDPDGPHLAWHASTPQWAIYLVGGPFVRYDRAGKPHVAAYLRQPAREIAARYLGRAEHYLALYEALIGPYPYPKFALVENFWETGLGMPSFTLIGTQVLRLPFILDTSYPHEIVHNWWGNGVHVKPGHGNWSEGLTAYLADHLTRELRGEARQYRRSALQKYRNYVAASDDFPLIRFRGGHRARTQAVGYNKALMMFHMLRRLIGDQAFRAGLRRFYAEHRFGLAAYEDLALAFEESSGKSLRRFFAQWTARVGAPALQLSKVELTPRAKGRYRLTGSIVQAQAEPPFELHIPLGVQLAGDAHLTRFEAHVTGPESPFALLLDRRPLRLTVDPEFDLFRRLDRTEIPASLGELFGRRETVIVIPAGPGAERDAYLAMARAWQRRFGWQIRSVDAPRLAGAPAIVYLGSGQRAVARLRDRLDGTQPAELLAADPIEADGQYFSRDSHSFAFAWRAGETTLGWITTPYAGTISLLARKLPHYGKFSYAVFRDAGAQNVARGQWPVTQSPLDRVLDPALKHTPIPGFAPRPVLTTGASNP